MTKRELQKIIKRMVERIVRRFHPDRVILFSSHARGTAGPDSDVDLLVVMPVTGSKREKQLEVQAAHAVEQRTALAYQPGQAGDREAEGCAMCHGRLLGAREARANGGRPY